MIGSNAWCTGTSKLLRLLAPEYIKTGRHSCKLDVFRFGVVSLEIVISRRYRDPRDYDIGPINWVWHIYDQDNLLSAVDKKVNMVFDEKQVKYMIFVGIWCTHSDHNLPPSIKLAVQVFNFEAGMPDLSAKMLVLTHNTSSPSNISSLPSITNSLYEAGR
ncbi:hypothetical protein GOBAR_AA02885 [Gossypium barbadense]|uniref:Serine-threonine/tyrosine-protein kinase catalytic domain-containing protein n=1 Tax=Gossypium barbadense TaxID=3634 RepID=A0A2P5YQ19_GOSBA|nr:hypothetical protein GOBAR_AA02885 [Gossypium barbadense]